MVFKAVKLNADVSLFELDKEEFWDVSRRLRPNLSREEYDVLWDNFVQMKKEKELN